MAAITATHLGAVTNIAGSSVSTGSVSPATNNLVIVSIYMKRSAGVGDVSSVSGNGITWNRINSVVNGIVRFTMYWGMSASPSAGAVTVNTTQSEDNFSVSVDEFANVDISSSGANAIVQNVTGTGNLTLAALGSANNAAYGGVGCDAGGTPTPGSGFTQLYNNNGNGFFETEWAINQTSVSWGGLTGTTGSMAIEIKAAPVASSGGSFLFNMI